MSLARRWLDPIRSRWFFNRPYRQRHLSSRNGITVYLRFDDAYSYLLVQLLPQLEELLIPRLKPLKIVICTQACPPPNGLSAQAWQQYMLDDAAALAAQHRFVFDVSETVRASLPSPALIQQATTVLKTSPLRGTDYLHLLQDIFHMLWQNQQGKLNTLHYMATRRPSPASVSNTAPDLPAIRFVDEPIASGFLLFGGRHYRAIDDFLRLTRRLKQQKLLNNEPIFLINHIEWGEHLVNDPESLNEIQALHARLDIYLALEDPVSWLILAYIKRELVDYYNLTLRVHPLPYQGRDEFDWGLIARLSRRTEISIAPFCRPTQVASLNLARILYSVDEEQRSETLLDLLKCVWCRGLDASFTPHVQRLMTMALDQQQLVDLPETEAWLASNQATCEAYQQPDLPVMVLQIGEQQQVFNSLYRVWRIESLLAEALEMDRNANV
ncbi:hypothetical protein [Alkanindiges illinoisensis]|uniref:DSBA-like thioredoxin domain-containing protein n=1 Tax=Alkanindiges illinoisensis TaxID=197183 RepID=A0A4Y7XB49_9GAMM|nr:hypothetical protein [Alkanindiges illinoisensis]TEU25589.1 hypothetical protein E2B99_09505 [Alkanindiges illinoisensis]